MKKCDISGCYHYATSGNYCQKHKNTDVYFYFTLLSILLVIILILIT
jgi:hypothetical protein